MKTTFCQFQDKYKCTVYALPKAKLIFQLAYTMYRVVTLYKQTAWNQFSCIVYTHSTAALLRFWKQLPLLGWPEPADRPGRGQLTPCLSAGWKGPLGRVYHPFLTTLTKERLRKPLLLRIRRKELL